MSAPVLTRTAPTDVPVLEILAERWSPRAYAAEDQVDEQQLASALEAARWAPSANNTQPWRFVVARRGTAEHRRIHDALVGFNQTWAGNAAVLIVAVAETADADGAPLPWAVYDLGQAVAHLSVQAHHDGLHVHQIGGFDRAAIREGFGIAERFEPITVIALGPIGDAADLPEALRTREVAPRVRRPLADSLIA